MKKFFTLFSALLLAMTVSAQPETALRETRVLDNMFISGSVGTSWSVLNRHRVFWKNVNPSATISVGKYITPVTGLQISFEGGAGEGGRQLVDHTNLTMDGLLNFSNLFGGYVGEPRRVEVVGVLGAGWFHEYDTRTESVSAKAAAQVNFNMGQKKAWQINVIPSYTYLPPKTLSHSYVALSVGLTYKFRNRNGSRHFDVVNVHDPLKWSALVDRVNELENQNNQLNKALAEKPKTIEKIVEKEVIREVPTFNNTVGFAIGKSDVTEQQMANLANLADVVKKTDSTIIVRGYADKQTGSAKRNLELSEARANAVKAVLVDKFGVDPSKVVVEAVGDTEQVYNENNWNRVVVFTKK